MLFLYLFFFLFEKLLIVYLRARSRLRCFCKNKFFKVLHVPMIFIHLFTLDNFITDWTINRLNDYDANSYCKQFQHQICFHIFSTGFLKILRWKDYSLHFILHNPPHRKTVTHTQWQSLVEIPQVFFFSPLAQDMLLKMTTDITTRHPSLIPGETSTMLVKLCLNQVRKKKLSKVSSFFRCVLFQASKFQTPE